MRCTAFFALTCLLLAGSAVASEQFSDVPPNHWAAEAVAQLANAGVVNGYPDGTFRGDEPVTRFELAVALARFVQFVGESRKPVISREQGLSGVPKWAAGSVAFLMGGGYVDPSLPLAADGRKPITADELARALASVAAALVEQQVPPPPEDSE